MTVYFHRDDETGPDERFEEAEPGEVDAALAKFREAVTNGKAEYACLEWIHVTRPAAREGT